MEAPLCHPGVLPATQDKNRLPGLMHMAFSSKRQGNNVSNCTPLKHRTLNGHSKQSGHLRKSNVGLVHRQKNTKGK